MKRNKDSIRNITSRPEFSVVLILVIMIFLTAFLQKGFFGKAVFMSNVNAFTPLILIAMGQAVVIVSGGLDLSAGTSMALMLCAMTRIMDPSKPMSGLVAIAACIGIAILIGLVNGFCVGYLRLPAVIATFATSYIWLGLALFITPTPGGKIVDWFKVFYCYGNMKNSPVWLQQLSSTLSSAMILILIAIIVWFIIRKTKTGHYMYAVGSDNDNAYASGINTTEIQIKAYMVNAFFIMLCALFFAGQNGAGSANIGTPLTLQAIAAAVIGGVSIHGGKGSVFMAIIGAIIMGLVSKIIYYANIPSAYQSFVSGVLIILAISASAIFDYVSNRRMLKGGIS